MKTDLARNESPIAGVTDPGYSRSRSRRLRFSLRTAMLLVLVAAVAASVWVNRRQQARINQLEFQLTRLRNEVGELHIAPGDENKLHAIELETLDAYTWKWRVYLPPGRRFNLRVGIGQISKAGSNQNGPSSLSQLSAGEQIITVTLRLDQEKRWVWVVHSNGSTSRMGVDAKWMATGRPSYTSTAITSGKATVVVAPDRPLELLRFRAYPLPPPGVLKEPELADGILVQIFPPE